MTESNISIQKKAVIFIFKSHTISFEFLRDMKKEKVKDKKKPRYFAMGSL